MDPLVLEEMLPYFSENYGNPSSMHTFGGKVGAKVDKARQQVAQLVGCHPEEVIFTSCGSEGDNAAIRSALATQPQKRHLVTTKVEHPAVLSLAKHLEDKGHDLTLLSVDAEGNLDLDELADSLRKDTALLSVMWANNETGVLFPIDKIAAIAKERGVLMHTDAVQAVGKVPVSLQDTPVDMLTLSGHKIHGPKGVGALIVRKGTRFAPFLMGGHQEHGRRAGTENTAGVIGLGKAAELAFENMHEERTRVAALRDRLENTLLETISDSIRNGNPNFRLPNTSSIAYEFVEGEAILLLLNEYGICASSGSACTSGSLEPSHVLRAMGVPFTFAHGSIRYSLSRFNTDEDVDEVLRVMPPLIERLRAISPFKPEESMTCKKH